MTVNLDYPKQSQLHAFLLINIVVEEKFAMEINVRIVRNSLH